MLPEVAPTLGVLKKITSFKTPRGPEYYIDQRVVDTISLVVIEDIMNIEPGAGKVALVARTYRNWKRTPHGVVVTQNPFVGWYEAGAANSSKMQLLDVFAGKQESFHLGHAVLVGEGSKFAIAGNGECRSDARNYPCVFVAPVAPRTQGVVVDWNSIRLDKKRDFDSVGAAVNSGARDQEGRVLLATFQGLLVFANAADAAPRLIAATGCESGFDAVATDPSGNVIVIGPKCFGVFDSKLSRITVNRAKP